MSDDFWMLSHRAECTRYFMLCLLLTYFTDYTFKSTLGLRKAVQWINTSLQQAGDALKSDEFIEHTVANRGFCALSGVVAMDAAKHAFKQVKLSGFAPINLPWFEKLQRAVQEDGRKLVLLRFPVRQDYLAAVKASGFDVWRRHDALYQSAHLLDCFEYSMSNEMWFDADHMNALGAAHFTHYIEPFLVALRNV